MASMDWLSLNEVLNDLDEATVLDLLNKEVEVYKRRTHIMRIHQRYSMLRKLREREELLAKAAV